MRAGYRVIVCFPHPGEAERTRLALRRVEAEPPGEGGAFTEPGVRFVHLGHPSRLCLGPAAARGASLGAALPPPRRRAALLGSDGRWRRSPICARATTSFTRIMASAVSSGSTPKRSPESCATTCISSSRARIGSTSPTISWPRSVATLAPTAGPRRSQARRQGLADAQDPRPRRGARAGRRAACAVCPPQHVTKRRSSRSRSGWRGSRKASRSRRPTISARPSTSCSKSSSPTGRWIGWSAATSDSARPRSLCGRRSRWRPPGGRC